MQELLCHITKESLNATNAVSAKLIKTKILELIQSDHPDFNLHSYVSIDMLNRYRKKYLAKLYREEAGELNHLQEEVIQSISDNKIIAENIEPEMEGKLNFGQRTADSIAKFGGSWTFILSFLFFILAWASVNTYFLILKPFDPYPFILLNLVLSCIAAIQAPLIIMSQNRVEEKDRKRGENDYKTNLKAELEIRLLNDKLDYLIMHQHKRMLEIQQLQMDYLEDILKSKKYKNNNRITRQQLTEGAVQE